MYKIKAYGKSEFAWMMFPKMRNPSAAQEWWVLMPATTMPTASASAMKVA